MRDLEAERAVLGSCLQSSSAVAIASRSLTVSDFHYYESQAVWTAIRQCVETGMAVDRATVYQYLPKRDNPSGAHLLDLEDASVSPGNISTYVSSVREHSTRRRMKDILTGALGRLDDVTIPAFDTATHIQTDLQETVGLSTPDLIAPEPLKSVINSWMASLEKGPQPTLSTPFDRVNGCLGGGIGYGELAYLGGRRGTGKSAMALQWAVTIAQAGKGVLIVSREMLKAQLARRLVAQVANVSSMQLKQAWLTDAEWVKTTSACGILSGLPIWITDGAEHIDSIDSAVSGFTQYPLAFVVIDYLQLVRAPKHIKERRLQVEEVSSRLKSLAMKRGIAILCLSSMRRPDKGDESIKPTLSDFRESGEIEHDGDIVMALHRVPMQHDASLLLWKTRDGDVGEIPMRFSGGTLRFAEVDP